MSEARDQIARYLRTLYAPGDVFEVRAPGYRDRPGATYAHTVAGYFTYDAIDKAAEEIEGIDRSGGAVGVYVTLNPVAAPLLSRAVNRIKAKAKETAQDCDIPGRRWLLIDVDSVRPAGISATDAELDAARTLCAAVVESLTAAGWPEPVVAMSGNGYHALYRVDLPNDDGGLIRRVLNALGDCFDTDAATVDRGNFNPARITKCIGTVCRKGDELHGIGGHAERRHRRAVIVSAPDAVQVVTREQLEFVGGDSEPERTRATYSAPGGGDTLDGTVDGVRAWLSSRGVDIRGERRNGDKTLLLLAHCPINPAIVSNGGSDIAVLVADDGKLAYVNQHSRGRGYTWADLRRVLEPEYETRGQIADGVDLSAFRLSPKPQTVPAEAVERDEPAAVAGDDPGPLPDELLRAPGFVSEVLDHCLATAPYPNHVMSFCGALSLQAFLAGRRVRDSGDNRTNLYLLGLAHSASGKDWPRKVNVRVAHEVGLADAIGDRFASGEGVQDALMLTPSMLFQTDEIDGMLLSVNKSKDARHESIMSTLLTLYSASNSVYPMRRRAGTEGAAGVIDQPCLVLFGTAIPTHYYDALSERMLTNGFFARTIALEGGKRVAGQEPRIAELPPRVLATAKWWADYRPGGGNLTDWHPVPSTVAADAAASKALVETRLEAEAEYARAEDANDAVGTTVWGRVSENARKLALIYAVSADHHAPRITGDAVRWASRLVTHTTRTMLYRAAMHVADTAFEAERLRLLRIVGEAGGRIAHQHLLKRMHTDARSFRGVVDTLEQRGELTHEDVQTATKIRRDYVAVKHAF